MKMDCCEITPALVKYDCALKRRFRVQPCSFIEILYRVDADLPGTKFETVKCVTLSTDLTNSIRRIERNKCRADACAK